MVPCIVGSENFVVTKSTTESNYTVTECMFDVSAGSIELTLVAGRCRRVAAHVFTWMFKVEMFSLPCYA